jgi:hypothetical protein
MIKGLTLLLVTRMIGVELLRHFSALSAASFMKLNFRHEDFPFAAIRIGIRSATRLWSMH